jgi:hypothetical protein
VQVSDKIEVNSVNRAAIDGEFGVYESTHPHTSNSHRVEGQRLNSRGVFVSL